MPSPTDSGSVVPEKKKPAIRKHSNGMLDPTPHGPYIAIAKKNQQDSPLLQLTAELRNKIFALVLGGRILHLRPSDSSKWRLSAGGHKSRVGRPSLSFEFVGLGTPAEQYLFLSLLLVCRQTYADAALLPFVLNTITYPGLRYVGACKRKPLATFQQNAISTLSIDMLAFANLEALLLKLKQYPGLKKVSIIFKREVPKWKTLMVEECSRMLLEAFGEGLDVQFRFLD